MMRGASSIGFKMDRDASGQVMAIRYDAYTRRDAARLAAHLKRKGFRTTRRGSVVQVFWPAGRDEPDAKRAVDAWTRLGAPPGALFAAEAR